MKTTPDNFKPIEFDPSLLTKHDMKAWFAWLASDPVGGLIGSRSRMPGPLISRFKTPAECDCFIGHGHFSEDEDEERFLFSRHEMETEGTATEPFVIDIPFDYCPKCGVRLEELLDAKDESAHLSGYIDSRGAAVSGKSDMFIKHLSMRNPDAPAFKPFDLEEHECKRDERYAKYDGHSIFLCYVCHECEDAKMAGFRPDIMERYEADEPIG
jgi:hypothetical protein